MDKIRFSSFYDDYNVSEINCIDLTKALYLSYYKTTDYYFYSFLSTVNRIYGMNDNIDSLLGYDTLSFDYKTDISFFKKYIDKKIPLIFYAKYNSLFYYKSYKDQKDYKHTSIIISDLDLDKDTICIMDMSISRKNTYPLHRGEFFNELQMPIKLFNQIVVDTISNLDQNLSYLKDSFYNIYIPNGNRRINNYKDLFLCLKGVLLKKEKFLEDNYFVNLSKDGRNAVEYLVSNYVNSYYVITNILSMVIKYYLNDISLIDKLSTIFEKRKGIILYAIATKLTNRFDENKTCLELDRLSVSIGEIIDYVIDNINFSNKINLVYQAKITADSELHSLSSLKNDSLINSYAFWSSNKKNSNHYLLFEFDKEYMINDIIIHHYGNLYNTMDYELKYSIDNTRWVTIINVKNNEEDINKISCNIKAKYIKIEITKASKIDNYARIKKVEIYGK